MNTKSELIDFCKSHEKVVLYGAGHYGKVVYEWLKEENIDIEGFCVSELDESLTFCGKRVLSIEHITKDIGIIITVSDRFARDIIKKLDGFFWFYNRELLDQIETEDMLKDFKNNDDVIIDDNSLISASEYHFDRGKMYILCPGSIGDTLHVAALVKAYKQKHMSGICRDVVIIVREGQSDIPDMFCAVDGKIVSDDLVWKLCVHCRYYKIWELDNFLYGFAREDFQHKFYNNKRIDMQNYLSGYKQLIMGVDEDDRTEKIRLKRYSGEEIISKHTVILMPHESSAKRLPLSFWELLCYRLEEEGFEVYTNVKWGSDEYVIKGSRKLEVRLSEIGDVCERSLAAVSIRTGICDLLAFTKTNLFVLNTEEEHAVKWDIKKAHPEKKNVCNLDCYSFFDEEEVIDKMTTILLDIYENILGSFL